MKFGRVIGNVVSTKKVDNISGLKLMIVKYLDENMKETKKAAACIDTVKAGDGDIVLVCSSSSARITSLTKNSAIDCAIVGIVDSVSSRREFIYRRDIVNKIGI